MPRGVDEANASSTRSVSIDPARRGDAGVSVARIVTMQSMPPAHRASPVCRRRARGALGRVDAFKLSPWAPEGGNASVERITVVHMTTVARTV